MTYLSLLCLTLLDGLQWMHHTGATQSAKRKQQQQSTIDAFIVRGIIALSCALWIYLGVDKWC